MDMIRKGPHLWVPQLYVYLRAKTKVEGIVRRVPRQDCVETQIWGRVPKNVCSNGPQEHSGLHNS